MSDQSLMDTFKFQRQCRKLSELSLDGTVVNWAYKSINGKPFLKLRA